MPRPVCVKCRREMQLEKPVDVMFNADIGGAYQAYQGDLARCPGCGCEVVARWGQEPFWERHRGKNYIGTPDLVIEEFPRV